MKTKSPSKLAFVSPRVLLGLFGAFIALALASSRAVGDTSSCPPKSETSWLSAPTPTATPLLTDFYIKAPVTVKPVLVLREGDATELIDGCNYWDNLNDSYHVVVQDIRAEDLFFKFDQDDGHTLLAGINLQSWSQGSSLAMEGGSNGGIVSYLAAVRASTTLRGIQARFATGDLLDYGLFNGGVWHEEIPWPPVDLPVGTPWKDYVSLPIWDKYLITHGDAGNAKVAGLHIGGWFDAFGQGILDTFSRMQTALGNGMYTKQKLVIGPWGHGIATDGDGYLPFPASLPSNPSITEYDTKWKNAVLRRLAADWTAWNALPVVQVYHMNAPTGTEWRTYTTWPPPATEVTFYFTPGHGLSGSHQSTGSLKFNSDPSSPCPTLGGINNLDSCVSPSPVPSPVPCGSFDQRPIEARQSTPGDVVVFTSAAVMGTVVGRMYADVWIQTDLPDVDIFVRMTDVFPDGHSMLVAQGIKRARYRNGGACPLPLDLTHPTQVHVDLGSTAWIFNTNHKLRVIVSAAAGPNRGGAPLYSINPQNGDEYVSVPPTNRFGTINVITGPGQESAVVLPQVNPQATPPPHYYPGKPTPCPH